MERRPKKSIAITLTNSFAMLNLVHSGLLQKLAAEYRIYIISDILNEDIMLFINTHFDISVQLLPLSIRQEPALIKVLRTIQKLTFFELYQIETHRIKMLRWHWSARFLMKVFRVILLSRLLKGIIIKSAKNCIVHLSTNHYKWSPNLPVLEGIISTSPLDIRENLLINCFKKQGIRSIGIVISWDNLTTKGVLNSHFDKLFVWNKVMLDECIRYHRHSCPFTQFSVTGNPRFDHYFRNRSKDLSESKINSARHAQRTILFATTPAKHFPAQTAIVEDLCEYSKIRKDILIVVRCHPLDNMSVYEAFQNPDLSIATQKCKPAPGSPPDRWIPEIDYLRVLRETVHSCDVCVQAASTFAIDAAACGKPVISIAYDGPSPLPFKDSVRRFYHYTHQATLNAAGLGTKVYSKIGLFEVLDDILFNDNAGTVSHKVLKTCTHFTSPVATKTMVQAIRKWLG